MVIKVIFDFDFKTIFLIGLKTNKNHLMIHLICINKQSLNAGNKFLIFR